MLCALVLDIPTIETGRICRVLLHFVFEEKSVGAEDAAENGSDKARMKANTHNLVTRKVWGTDQYYEISGFKHNESLIPINYQDMLSYQQLTLITDHPGQTRKMNLREITQQLKSRKTRRVR